MKNRLFMASLGLVLLFALSFAACKHDSDATPFDGTWERSGGGYTLVFSENNWTNLQGGANAYKGIFTYDAATLTRNITHYWNGSSWVSQPGATNVHSYTLNGNILIIDGVTYNRQ
jgi:hypothetical protein